MLDKIKRKIKGRLRDAATVGKSSQSIAFGFALGSFIAVSPTFGFGPVIGLILVLIFRKISKLSLFSSFLIWNPFVLFFLYSASFGIGNVILSETAQPQKIETINQVFVYSRMFLLGNLILAIVISVASYFIVFSLVEGYKRRKALKKNKIIIRNGKRPRKNKEK